MHCIPTRTVIHTTYSYPLGIVFTHCTAHTIPTHRVLIHAPPRDPPNNSTLSNFRPGVSSVRTSLLSYPSEQPKPHEPRPGVFSLRIPILLIRMANQPPVVTVTDYTTVLASMTALPTRTSSTFRPSNTTTTISSTFSTSSSTLFSRTTLIPTFNPSSLPTLPATSTFQLLPTSTSTISSTFSPTPTSSTPPKIYHPTSTTSLTFSFLLLITVLLITLLYLTAFAYTIYLNNRGHCANCKDLESQLAKWKGGLLHGITKDMVKERELWMADEKKRLEQDSQQDETSETTDSHSEGEVDAGTIRVGLRSTISGLFRAGPSNRHSSSNHQDTYTLDLESGTHTHTHTHAYAPDTTTLLGPVPRKPLPSYITSPHTQTLGTLPRAPSSIYSPGSSRSRSSRPISYRPQYITETVPLDDPQASQYLEAAAWAADPQNPDHEDAAKLADRLLVEIRRRERMVVGYGGFGVGEGEAGGMDKGKGKGEGKGEGEGDDGEDRGSWGGWFRK
ncbi:hypothetical protein M011DRAFT_512382 [Sporormia fimetaria CBS 119925]|uniref:Uncharacterized protein n=1 Tax=Sporormia fimetaria CBS 119925 TaxID=1340428 RepID=A0A6A6UYX1_9PLEO|nr:hypothetical protein M011DRAFT_512382 [Sporormia fimetaria CBS 119925]